MDKAMNPRDPLTWNDLANHPVFEGGRFDPNWYDGNVKEDLFRLRNAIITILNSFPTWSCELVVLDDCTMYVNLQDGHSTVGSLYPAVTDDFNPCFFLDFEGNPTEIRARTAIELVGILRDLLPEGAKGDTARGAKGANGGAKGDIAIS
jgi:hypothetical protein